MGDNNTAGRQETQGEEPFANGDSEVNAFPSSEPSTKLIVIPGGKAEEPKDKAEEPKDQWTILGLQDAYKDADVPPWLIRDLVMANTVTLVSAHPHAMKSLSWLFASLEGVVTKKVFGHFEAPKLNNVLFIETEDPEWLVKKRLQGFAKGLNLKEGRDIPGFHFVCPGPFGLTAEIKRLEKLIKNHKLDLIVLSTLQNVLEGRDWRDQKEMAEVLKNLVQTARLCPIVVLTHSPQDQRQRRAAGTITLGANCATLIHYDKSVIHKTGDTFVSLSVDSKAGATEPEFSLKLLTDPKDSDPVSSVRGLIYAGKGKKRKRSDKDAILDFLEENPDATTEEIMEATGAGERNAQKVRNEFNKSRKNSEEQKANSR